MADSSPTIPNESNPLDGKEPLSASIRSYDVGLLMAQTRQLAADYREQTGQALPVTEELARFDAINLMGLKKVVVHDNISLSAAAQAEAELEGSNLKVPDLTGIDATNASADESYLIKGRVIFKGGKARQKLGQLGLHCNWSHLLMVIYDPQYQPCQIFKVERSIIEKELEKLPVSKRGSMTVAKYKAIGELIWAEQD